MVSSVIKMFILFGKREIQLDHDLVLAKRQSQSIKSISIMIFNVRIQVAQKGDCILLKVPCHASFKIRLGGRCFVSAEGEEW